MLRDGTVLVNLRPESLRHRDAFAPLALLVAGGRTVPTFAAFGSGPLHLEARTARQAHARHEALPRRSGTRRGAEARLPQFGPLDGGRERRAARFAATLDRYRPVRTRRQTSQGERAARARR
jgi:hypothetical protein